MCELRTSNALFNQIEALKMRTAKMTKMFLLHTQFKFQLNL